MDRTCDKDGPRFTVYEDTPMGARPEVDPEQDGEPWSKINTRMEVMGQARTGQDGDLVCR